MKTTDITKIALITAILCILAPLAINIGPVPISFTNLVLYIAIYIIGTKNTLISYMVYFLMGLVGLPVLSNYQSGLSKIAGPTGGYLVGFIFMVLIGGFFIENFKSRIIHFAGLVLATAAAYGFGTVWYFYEANVDFVAALMVCVVPFIIGDVVKIVIASVLGTEIKKRTEK